MSDGPQARFKLHDLSEYKLGKIQVATPEGTPADPPTDFPAHLGDTFSNDLQAKINAWASARSPVPEWRFTMNSAGGIDLLIVLH